MSIPSSGTSSKSADGLSDQFPAGLRVLVVDDDALCLKILEKMLRKCLYEVTKCNRAEIALKFLRDNKNGFDIVLSDVHMPDMDGFKLLEQVGLEMDLPVIMMSADDSKNIVMKGVTHGACDYLIKPVRMEALKNIWQHVIRKKKHELKDKDFEQSGSVEDGEPNKKCQDDIDYSSSANEGNLKNSRKRNDEEDEVEEDSDTCALKKPRIVWSVELHQQFVAAVHQLGIDKVVPKRILELMNVPGLRRENVASHLQKYRLYLKRLSVDSQHQNGVNSPYIGLSNANFGTISSLHGIDFQAQPTSQIPGQSLAALQAVHRSSNKSPISIVDQRNFFSFESPKLGFSEGEQVGNNIDQMNLFHGIPTTMDPKQLPSLNQSNVPRHPLLNGVSGVGLARGVSSNICSTVYNPSVVDFSPPLYGNSFPNIRNTGSSSLSLREGLQGDVNLGSKRFVPGYYELQQYASHPSVQSSGQGGFGDAFFSPVGGGHNFNPNFGLPPNMVDARFKVESLQDARCPNNIFLQHLGQDDIFYNSLLEQKDVETHFGFDTYLSNDLLA